MNVAFESIVTFLTEALRLLGWGRIALVAGALVLAALAAGWLGAKLLARGGKPFMSALCAALFLLLTAVVVGGVYAAVHVEALQSTGVGASDTMKLGCAFFGGVLVLLGVHGAFGTPAWKSAVLLPLVVGGASVAGCAVTRMVFPDQSAQLDLLARQVTGRTSAGPWLVASAEATRKIEIRRVSKDRERLLQEQAGLGKPYQELQVARAKLKPQDSAAVTAFNARAAAYAAEVQRIKNALAALDALEDSVKPGEMGQPRKSAEARKLEQMLEM